jgi:hypothetical protein
MFHSKLSSIHLLLQGVSDILLYIHNMSFYGIFHFLFFMGFRYKIKVNAKLKVN